MTFEFLQARLEFWRKRPDVSDQIALFDRAVRAVGALDEDDLPD